MLGDEKAINEIKRRIGSLKFTEMSLEEKVETLKQEIIYLRNSVSALSRSTEKMMEHGHGHNGEVTVPLMPKQNQYGGECRFDPLSA